MPRIGSRCCPIPRIGMGASKSRNPRSRLGAPLERTRLEALLGAGSKVKKWRVAMPPPHKGGHCFRCKIQFMSVQVNIFSCSSTSRAFHLHCIDATLPAQTSQLEYFRRLPDAAKVLVASKLSMGKSPNSNVSSNSADLTLPILEQPLDDAEEGSPADTSAANGGITYGDWWDDIQWEDILNLEVNTSMCVPASIKHAVATARGK